MSASFKQYYFHHIKNQEYILIWEEKNKHFENTSSYLRIVVSSSRRCSKSPATRSKVSPLRNWALGTWQDLGYLRWTLQNRNEIDQISFPFIFFFIRSNFYNSAQSQNNRSIPISLFSVAFLFFFFPFFFGKYNSVICMHHAVILTWKEQKKKEKKE